VDDSWRARVARVPDWVWLAGIVVASAALRAWLVRAMPAPFVFVDELIYSELARSIADAGTFAVRGVPTSGYSVLYPILLAPAYAIFDVLPSAYAAAKTTNAVAMSLAAVPAWLIARRVAGRGLALVCAVTAVAVPSMAYTATVVTETLFYRWRSSSRGRSCGRSSGRRRGGSPRSQRPSSPRSSPVRRRSGS